MYLGTLIGHATESQKKSKIDCKSRERESLTPSQIKSSTSSGPDDEKGKIALKTRKHVRKFVNIPDTRWQASQVELRVKWKALSREGQVE